MLKRGLLEKESLPVAPYTGGGNLRTASNRNIFHIRAGYADKPSTWSTTSSPSVSNISPSSIRMTVLVKTGKKGRKALDKRGLKLAASATYERNTDEVSTAVATIRKSKPVQSS